MARTARKTSSSSRTKSTRSTTRKRATRSVAKSKPKARAPRKISAAKKKMTASELAHHNHVENVLIFSFFVCIFIFAAILVFASYYCKAAWTKRVLLIQQPLVEQIHDLELRIQVLESRK